MCRVTDYLENSRTAQVIDKLEKGEHVDFGKLRTLQAFDTVRLGELFALDHIESEREADDKLLELFGEKESSHPPGSNV